MSRTKDTAKRTCVCRGQVHPHTKAFAKLQERRITAGITLAEVRQQRLASFPTFPTPE